MPSANLAAEPPGSEVVTGNPRPSDAPKRVRPGLEVLISSNFSPLAGKKIGVITNHTGLDSSRRSTLNILLAAPGVKVRAIFSPEHGLAGILDEKVASGVDPLSGLPVYSLYGEVQKPTPEMLQELDALVYDIQDIGVRFYTYITTMAYAMEAAASAGIDFYVLDRPNPISADIVQGPVLDSDLKSFIGYYPIPVRYGMTPGELAQLFNKENHIKASLKVIKMEGYRRQMWFDQTNLPWINPSPNLRSLTQALLYSGVALIESANISVGRGTDKPFEIMGAPWISGVKLAEYLSQRQIAGVTFEPVDFVPQADWHRRKRCEGVRLKVVNRSVLNTPLLGIELASALCRLFPGKLDLDKTLSMIGSREVLQNIKNGEDPKSIFQRWQAELEAFRRVREKYLLY